MLSNSSKNKRGKKKEEGWNEGKRRKVQDTYKLQWCDGRMKIARENVDWLTFLRDTGWMI